MRSSDLVRAAAGLAAPPRCGICAADCGWRELACARCRRALAALSPVRRALPGLDAVIAAAPYRGIARELVAALKFRSRPALAPLAAEAIVRALEDVPDGLPGAAAVPVPAARWRASRRGFDPAELLAAAVAERLGVGLVPCLARRGGRRQVGRSRPARLARPPLASCVHPPPARVLLIDDVLTTGATLAACARALRDRGSGEVVAAAFAAALPGPGGAPPPGSRAALRSRAPEGGSFEDGLAPRSALGPGSRTA